MKTSIIRLIVISAITTAVGYGGVWLYNSAIQKSAEKKEDPQKYERVLKDYTYKATIPSLRANVTAMEEFQQAVKALAKSPTDANVDKAAAAWKKSSASYNRLVAFLFGPGIHYAFDRQISIFPMDEIMLEQGLKEIRDGVVASEEVNGRYLRGHYLQTVQGLPAAEWILFRDGKTRPAADITPEQMLWLQATAESLVASALDWEAAWRGTTEMSAEEIALLEKGGKKKRRSFGAEFSSPGTKGNRYASPSVCLQEIFQEYLQVVEDIQPEIIPSFETADLRNTMSWHAGYGAENFASQIDGVANAYLGGLPGARGASVSDLVAEKNPVLDRRIKISLAHTAHRLRDLQNLDGLTPEERMLRVRRADQACAKLGSNLGIAMPLVCMDPAAKPFAPWGRE